MVADKALYKRGRADLDERLKRDITYVKGIGPKKAEVLGKVGIRTVYDLLQYCPRDCGDRAQAREIKDTSVNNEGP